MFWMKSLKKSGEAFLDLCRYPTATNELKEIRKANQKRREVRIVDPCKVARQIEVCKNGRS